MKEIKVSEQPKLLNEIVASLRQASGGASQLAHHFRDPRWITIREMLDLVQEGVLEVASFATKLSVIKP